MKVVIDTNIIISAIGKYSPFRKIFDSILRSEIEVYISNEIFLEYKDVLYRKTSKEITDNFSNLFVLLPNVVFTNIYFHWYLIRNDIKDNKFTDCYIASNAELLITEDKHFNILKEIEFPKIKIISANEFIQNYIS